MGPLSSAVVRDISLSGVRCITQEPLKPMALVALRLVLPSGRPGEDAWDEVPCEGIVVRCHVLESGEESRYESAILFKDLGPRERETIATFVDRRLGSRTGD